jgi:hypothetical protein
MAEAFFYQHLRLRNSSGKLLPLDQKRIDEASLSDKDVGYVSSRGGSNSSIETDEDVTSLPPPPPPTSSAPMLPAVKEMKGDVKGHYIFWMDKEKVKAELSSSDAKEEFVQSYWNDVVTLNTIERLHGGGGMATEFPIKCNNCQEAKLDEKPTADEAIPKIPDAFSWPNKFSVLPPTDALDL